MSPVLDFPFSAPSQPSLLVIYTGHLSQVQAAVAMITLLVHDTCYGASLALNTLLIALIITKTPSYLRQVFFFE